MSGRAADVARVLILASLVTAAMAVPVLRAPTERVFGAETVGRHHDPFTVMKAFTQPIALGVSSQPLTDVEGAIVSRAVGPVVGYNLLVLLSFPLSAVGAYLLARHLTLSVPGAAVAAMAYAFSPFHLAHAAYHPHIAQTQWIPLYLLALWRCLDEASPLAIAALAAAAGAVTLSNFYGGLIAAVMTPVAVGTYWWVAGRSGPRATRRLGLTVGALVCIAVAGLAYAGHAARAGGASPETFTTLRTDLFRYSARWWGYLVPPVAHPLLGAAARRVWAAADVHEGLLEQQVALGWGIVALGLVAIARWRVRGPRAAELARVPILVGLALVALVCSLSPEHTIAGLSVISPSALLYSVLPMFRAYARFGVVVQLMAALLAGIGVDVLLRDGTRRARIACLGLVVLAAAEYVVPPSALARDVLPTAAHRWVARQPGPLRVLDCVPLDPESASVPWLTQSRVALLGGAVTDCTEPDLPQRLAASGFTHVLVRRDAVDRPAFADEGPLPDGLLAVARFDDGQVFVVTAGRPPVYVSVTTGFPSRERDAAWTWRWMNDDGGWRVVSASDRPIAATLSLELSAFDKVRHLEVRLDGRLVQTLVVAPARRVYDIGPLFVSPGSHELGFHPVEAPTVATAVLGNGDTRRLSFALGAWTWRVGHGSVSS